MGDVAMSAEGGAMGWEIHEGDCLDVMRGIPDHSIDAIICDPPYGTTACKWDSVIPFAPMWEQLKRIAKPKAAIVLFGSQPFTSALVMSNPAMFRYEWIWQKNRATGHLDAKRRPLKAHESIVVFAEGQTTYNPQMTAGETHVRGPRGRALRSCSVYGTFNEQQDRCYESDAFYPQSALKFGVESTPIHPTQKPVALMEYLIRTYTNEGDTVLDFTCGSGSTGVAAINTNRHFVGIEKEPEYAAIACQRLTAASQQPALVGVA